MEAPSATALRRSYVRTTKAPGDRVTVRLTVALEFRILGPLEVQAEGRAIALGGPQQRAVLAVLLLHAGSVVSTERLIDDLWGDTVPPSARAVLQGYVSNLRKAIGGVLVTRAPGYVVELAPEQLDLHVFELLLRRGREELAAGRPEAAAETLHSALALWRGRALADFADEPFAGAAILRLEELRLAALEERIDAELALGRQSTLVGELEALVAEYPLRERFRSQLMLALYRSGRQAEALDAYQAARRVLVDELGIEPGRALQELERAILNHDPIVDAPRHDVAQPVTASPVPGEGVARTMLVVSLRGTALGPLVSLAAQLASRPQRAVILAALVASPADLVQATNEMHGQRDQLAADGIDARSAAFVSDAFGEDVARLASQQHVDVVLLGLGASELADSGDTRELQTVLERTPCDVAVFVAGAHAEARPGPTHPVLVPFGGTDHDWTAAEIAAWIAAATSAPLQLLGTMSDLGRGRRDASRLLANVALALQAATGVDAEPRLVEPGDEAVIDAAEDAGMVVVGLSERWRQEGIGRARLAVATLGRPPTLLVRRGLRPGALAPMASLTRFTWTIAPT